MLTPRTPILLQPRAIVQLNVLETCPGEGFWGLIMRGLIIGVEDSFNTNAKNALAEIYIFQQVGFLLHLMNVIINIISCATQNRYV